MNKFTKIFGAEKFKVIGMIHVAALPGTPRYEGDWSHIIERATYEAEIYKKHEVDAVLIENMHDVPYLPQRYFGPELTACMTRVSQAVRNLLPSKIPCGVQVLACGNKEALAVAKAASLQFIRAEGFVFGHVADEGYTDACAGELLRYRRQIDANDVLVFTDIKKKHSANAITADVDLLDTAKAAEMFLTDGIIITGTSTGYATSPKDLKTLAGQIESPILIGSGVTSSNVEDYFSEAHGAIIGSHFKQHGDWSQALCENAISDFMQKVNGFRQASCIKKKNFIN